MKRVGLVGWRGMVGSVLMQRMVDEGDFAHIEPVYFSTSAAGAIASFITQPLEVIKTNRINSPAIFYSDVHKKIISSGERATAMIKL